VFGICGLVWPDPGRLVPSRPGPSRPGSVRAWVPPAAAAGLRAPTEPCRRLWSHAGEYAHASRPLARRQAPATPSRDRLGSSPNLSS